MSNDINERLKNVQDQISAAKAREMRASILEDQAKERIAGAIGKLKSDYNLGSVEEAKKMVTSLESFVVSKLAEAEKELQEAMNE